MVRLIEEEVIEYIPELLQGRITNREIYKTFLKQLLEEFLPPHDRAQDELVQELQRFIFLPLGATPEQVLIYEKLCHKQAKLLDLHLQRDQITLLLWAFYNEEFPDLSHEKCQELEVKLVEGKKKFYRLGKKIKKWLFRLHSINQ